MTIKELEERTGMTRANIRYYESEGLLSPKRLDNGYRDYSEDDAVTLEKIKLLRELRLDIDAIRLVQKGELTLEQALFNLLTRLEGEKTAIGRAAEVCRELERSGVEYGALDPKPWLGRLEQPRRAPLTEAPKTASQYDVRPEQDPVDYAYYHPWMRFLARSVDVGLYQLVICAFLGLVCRVNLGGTGRFASWLIGLAALLLMILAEPFWLHFWGWTPGKWMFGLKVRDKWGNKLSIGEGFTRAGGVLAGGYGCHIPFVDLWCAWKFWKRYKNEENCPWDENSDFVYIHEERRLSWLIWLGAEALTIFLVAVIVLQGYLPPNRGPLTAEEYYENFNFYLSYFGFGHSLDENGEWEPEYSGNGVVTVYLNNLSYSGVSVELEDGYVSAVTLSDCLDPDDGVRFGGGVGEGGVLYMSQAYYQIAAAALAGAQREFNCFSYGLEGWLGFWDDKWDSFEEEYRGLHFSQTVECSGYEGIGQIRVAAKGQKQSYSRTVTISLNGSD